MTARGILLNKPYGVLSQFTDKGTEGSTRPTLSAYIDEKGFYPAGRLDRDSEGLLVLTDHGPLQARIAHPKYKRPKTYLVQVEGTPDAVALEALRRDKTVQEIAAKQQLHPTRVSTWEQLAIEGMAGVFSDKVKKAKNKDGKIKELHAKIGQLAVENDFLSQGLKR